MDHSALFAIQGCLGLDCPPSCHLYGHLYSVCGRFPPQRVRLQQQEEQRIRRRSHCRYRSSRYALQYQINFVSYFGSNVLFSSSSLPFHDSGRHVHH